MKTIPFVLSLFSLMLASTVIARPLDAIGPCDSKRGTLQIAQGIYQGKAPAMLTIADYAARHITATEQEEPWLKSLSGISGKNRLFRNGKKEVVVMTVCNPSDCEGNRAYIAYEPATGEIGGAVYEGRHVRDFGATADARWYPESLGPAIICSQNLDWGKK